MATALLFFSLSPPTPTPFFLHRNPKPYSSSLLLPTSSPLSISTSTSRNPNAAVPRGPVVSARAAAPLAAPAPTSADAAGDLLDISKLGISEHIVSALARRGITELFPIQRAVLEPAMEGRDMIGRAITGSGKTLAFGIPILDKIIRHQSQHRKKRVPSALVLAPTRELARQVQREFKESAPNLSSTCLYGGIPIINQVRDLGFGMDIVVGTPGRIIDLVERGALDLSEVKFAVLDEADQMLAIGFQEDVECILSYLPAKKQCMLFSATMPSWINDLSRKYLRNPLVIDLVGGSEQKLAEGISLYSVASTATNKQNLLSTLISRYAHGGKSIIFTRTKKDAESLSRTMGSIIKSRALHGNMQQFQRDRTLTAFRDGRFNVLVATDVAARGLDIPNVDLIIHFELPNTSEIFVHRSGRTGRAGNKGTAVLMFTEGQRRDVRSIERDLRCKFEELQGITGSVGGRQELSDEYYDSAKRKLGSPNQFSDRRYGNYGRFQESSISRYPKEDSFRGSERPRKNQSSRKSEPRHAGHAQTRRNHLVKYDDFEENNEMGIDSSRWSPSTPTVPRRHTNRRQGPNRSGNGHDDYDDLLDLFKDQY